MSLKEVNINNLLKIILAVFILSFIIYPDSNTHANSYWQQVSTNGLGDATNTAIFTMENWQDVLYIGVGRNTGARIYRSTNGNTFTNVSPADGFGHPELEGIYDFTAFDGQLFVSAFDEDDATSGEVWRSPDGITWTQTGVDGLGNANNDGFYKMKVFNNQLYVGSRNPTEGSEIYRTADGANWNLVPLTAGGFGDANNVGVWSLETDGGFLYAGTFNAINGAQLWRSADGTNWNLVLDFSLIDGNNVGISTIYTYSNNLYFGTMNFIGGAEIWGWDGANWGWDVGGLGDVNNNCFSIHPVTVGSSVYFGSRNAITGGELWWANSPNSQYSQIGDDGFGDVNNWALYALTFKGYLYVGFSNNNSGVEIWRLRSGSSMVITTKILAQGQEGSNYTAILEIVGGTNPYTWAIVSGSLPKGLSLNNSTGEIFGIPEESGDFEFVVEVQDSGKKQQTARKTFILKIIAGVSDNTDESNSIRGITILPQTGKN